jgi:hypothetical protein
MTLILSGTNGLSDVDGSAATPAIRGTDANTGIFFPAADTIAFSEGGVESMRIDSSGNLGIGASPSYRLDVNATSFIAASVSTSYSGAGNIRIADASTTSASAPYIGSVGNNLTFGRLGTAEYARIDSSGNLLVGTTSSDISAVGIRLMNNNQLQASKGGDWSFRMGRRDSTGIIAEIYYNSSRVGDISTNGSNTTYNSASDYRLKENVQPMVGALGKVAALKPVTFTWKATSTNDEGFLAHELQAVVPQAVRGEKDEVDADGEPVYQSIDTSVLVATLTAAIQEQQALITALTARITALEAK